MEEEEEEEEEEKEEKEEEEEEEEEGAGGGVACALKTRIPHLGCGEQTYVINFSASRVLCWDNFCLEEVGGYSKKLTYLELLRGPPAAHPGQHN